MKQIFIKSAALLFLSGMLFFSCNKADEQPDLDTNTTSDNANSQSSFDDAAKVTEDVMAGNGSGKLAAGGNSITCAEVNVDTPSVGVKKFTITFTPGCISYDGKARTGSIIAVLTGASYNTPGATLVLSFSNYTVNGHKVEGMKKDSCVSTGVHNISVSDTSASMSGFAKITYSNGETVQWKSKRTRTLASAGGAGILDNVYDISSTPGVGNPVASGINRNGKSYTVDIVSPIRIDFNCFTTNQTARYPTQGVLNITPEGKLTRSIDYGNGTCDNNVKVTVGGKTYDITLTY